MSDSEQNTNQSPSDYESSVEFFLDAANDALQKGHSGLATHLFCAAFEVSQEKDYAPNDKVIEGLRTAWRLACDQGDRSMAETIFTHLVPYSTPKQMQNNMEELQGLAMNQLEDMGLSRDDVENMAGALGQEISENIDSENIDAAAIEGIMGQIQNMLFNGAAPDEKIHVAHSGHAGHADDQPVHPMVEDIAKTVDSKPDVQQKAANQKSEDAPLFDYDSLAGYGQALQEMRVYGFEGAGDEEYREFLQKASEMHGIRGLMLHDPFLFYGRSRDDVALFAQATAGEIGRPVVTMHVEMDDAGMGSIKLAGPFRRSIFGSPDPTEFPSPCTFMVENVDMLETIFNREEAEQLFIQPQQGNAQGNNMRIEVTSYIHALMNRPGVFLIMTGTSPELSATLRRSVGAYQAIEISDPTYYERVDVWRKFAQDHPSFQGLNFNELAAMSEGADRRDIFDAGRVAVKTAYRASLKDHAIHNVTTGDVLVAMGSFLDHDSPTYGHVVDQAVSEFSHELDGLLDAGDDSLPAGTKPSSDADGHAPDAGVSQRN